CPNKCRDAPFERQNVKNHVKDECPLTEIDCPLHYAGCEVRLLRKDMPEHMTDTVTHLTLLATVTQSLLKENQKLRQTTEVLKKENQKLRQTTEVLKKENQKLRQTTEDLKKKNQKQEKEVEILREEMHQMKVMVGVFPIDLHVKYDKDKETIYLPSFYTHSSGYQMCITFYSNGHGDGKGTHVSLFTHLMQGPYDDHLKWPFRGEITVQIVNQTGDHSHVERTISYNDETPDDTAGRVTDKESANGWGFNFLAHTDLEYNAAKKTQYLKDGIIIVRVVEVIITQ
ncbi:TNF receptor-associated factor 4, partial [Geodia barretti]